MVTRSCRAHTIACETRSPKFDISKGRRSSGSSSFGNALRSDQEYGGVITWQEDAV